MQSKTSFCNGTVLKKNLTRFAPLWLLYALCLLLVSTLMYMEDGQQFWFASRMGELIQYSALVNLFYAPAAALLLFGDLYNSRLCYGLHTLPLKRGCLYRTHILSGVLFSLIPTALVCGLAIPLLSNTCVVNGWQIGLWTFLGMNLTFLCFFGIAVVSALCVGNRFALIAMYALFNGGAYVAYFLIDTIYTPMLYGVVTPNTLAQNLTPIANLMEAACLELDNYNDLMRQFGGVEAMVANYHLLSEGWLTVGIWSAVGFGAVLLGGWMYKKRQLECAGDTMATKLLEPVFQICISICAAAFFSIFVDLFIGSGRFRFDWQYLFLGSGLVVGWFAGRMLIERTVRVFRGKNFLGLFLLAAALVLSLAATNYDVFGIESWVPRAEDVKSVTFGHSLYRGMSEELTDKADIEEVIRLQQLALEDRVENSGTHLFLDGQEITWDQRETSGREGEVEYRYSAEITVHYEMETGRTVTRKYMVWGDGEAADIVNEYLSRWEVVSNAAYYNEIAYETVYTDKELVGDIWIQVDGQPAMDCTREDIDSLLAAIMADCEARTMTQRTAFHEGHFAYANEFGETVNTRSMWIEFSGKDFKSGSFTVFADSENTLNWLKERGLLKYEVREGVGFVG